MKKYFILLAKKIFLMLPNAAQEYVYRLYLKFILKNREIQNLSMYQDIFRGKCGIEIGGPSFAFRAILPIYSVMNKLDGVNYSSFTKWEGSISEGMNYKWFWGKTGRQFISECTNLGFINDSKYEFLISSNCLEHTANPLKALKEWVRVIQPGGYILLVLPKKDNNFDNKRPTTEFSHLIDDYNCDMGEDDTTHLQEVLNLHDLSKDQNAGGFEVFKKTCLSNIVNREMHHHVFDVSLIKKVFQHLNIELLHIESIPSDNIFLGKTKIG